MQTSYPPAARKNNGNAIASLVLGILSWLLFLMTICLNWVILPVITIATLGVGFIFYLCTGALACISPIGWLIGFVLGHKAKKQILQTGEGGTGMATTGYILNLIGLILTLITLCGVIAILAVSGTAGLVQYFGSLKP
jgi:hypothetical protein